MGLNPQLFGIKDYKGFKSYPKDTRPCHTSDHDMCKHAHPGGYLGCTLKKGHKGRHLGHGGIGKPLGSWDNDEK